MRFVRIVGRVDLDLHVAELERVARRDLADAVVGNAELAHQLRRGTRRDADRVSVVDDGDQRAFVAVVDMIVRGDDDVGNAHLVRLDRNGRRPVGVRHGVVRRAVGVGIDPDHRLRRAVNEARSSQRPQEDAVVDRSSFNLVQKCLGPICYVSHIQSFDLLRRASRRRGAGMSGTITFRRCASAKTQAVLQL